MTTTAELQRRRIFVDGEWLDTDRTLSVDDLADGGTFAEIDCFRLGVYRQCHPEFTVVFL